MTRSHKLDEGTAVNSPSATLECAKCGYQNERRRNTCDGCGAHLHIICHECGHRNERIALQCVECGKRLHRGWWRRLGKKLFRRNPKLSVLQLVLLVVVVYAAYKIITKLVEFRPVILQ